MSRLLRTLPWLLMLLCTPLHASSYPRTLTDLAGRQVVLAQAPQRILLQDSNDLLSLALLEHEDPLRRIVAWGNGLAGSDPALWQVVVEHWPHARQVRQVEFVQSGQIDIEGLLRTHPDLVVARLQAKAAIENTVLYSVLERLGIPLLYVDNEQDPLRNVPRSLSLLGQALGRETEAQAYLEAYQQRLQALRNTARGLPAPRVFVEARAGQAGSGGCCHTQGDAGWGLLVQGVGGINLGSQYQRSGSSDVALETLILAKPDLYLMTGTQRVRNGVSAIPFGYGTDATQVHAAMARLMQRPGFAAVANTQNACVQGLNHQFYNSVFNIVGAQWLAKLLWPHAFATLDPDAEYRHLVSQFTTLPERPFIFHGQACFDQLDAS